MRYGSGLLCDLITSVTQCGCLRPGTAQMRRLGSSSSHEYLVSSQLKAFGFLHLPVSCFCLSPDFGPRWHDELNNEM